MLRKRRRVRIKNGKSKTNHKQKSLPKYKNRNRKANKIGLHSNPNSKLKQNEKGILTSLVFSSL